jgi:hypothetical protein
LIAENVATTAGLKPAPRQTGPRIAEVDGPFLGRRERSFGDTKFVVAWSGSRQDALPCAEFCLSEIERVGRGIVLLHDSSEDAELRRWNRIHEVVEMIVPALGQRGYRFIGLGDVPAVQMAKTQFNRDPKDTAEKTRSRPLGPDRQSATPANGSRLF